MAVALSPTYQSKLLTDPRYMSAVQGLQNGTSMAPVKGGWAEGIARALSAGLYSSSMKDIENDFVQKDKNNNETIQQAFDNGQALPAETKQYKDGTSIDWQARPADFNRTIQALSQNPETSDLATQMLSLQAKAQIDNQMKANEPLTPFQRMQLQTENQVDAYGNIVPKYSLDRAGGLPPVGGAAAALSAPVQNPTTAAPEVQQMPVGTIQPPAMRGTPDSTPTTPAAALLAPPAGISAPRQPQGGLISVPATGKPRIDIENAGKVAGANIDLQKTALQSQADAKSMLNTQVATLPQLKDTVQRLNKLADTATYTMGGRINDSFNNMVGLPQRQEAVDRAEYISTVKNQVLPLLRQTFGSQFTAREGDSLLETLGDPNTSPLEKKSVLKSFINSKMENLKTTAREAGYTPEQVNQLVAQFDDAPAAPPAQASPRAPAIGEIMDGHRFKGGDPSKPENWEAVR